MSGVQRFENKVIAFAKETLAETSPRPRNSCRSSYETRNPREDHQTHGKGGPEALMLRKATTIGAVEMTWADARRGRACLCPFVFFKRLS